MEIGYIAGWPSAVLVESAAELCRAAGEIVMRHYTDGCAATTKADGSMVTEADRAAEAVIAAGLKLLTPGIPVVAEEDLAGRETPDCPPGPFWLVDPLDGTREFIDRNGEFTVNLALIEDGEPVLGIVLAPALARLYAGARGLGAFAQTPAGRSPIKVRSVPRAGLIVVGSRSHGDENAMASYLRGKMVACRKPAGSSLKFCLIAAGEADLYPRFGRTMEWDTAAGHAVLNAAGGQVRQLDGAPLRYGKPNFENPHFIASGGSPPIPSDDEHATIPV